MWQCYTVLITIALKYSLKSGSVIPPALFLFLSIALIILVLLWFHISFINFCSISVKKCPWLKAHEKIFSITIIRKMQTKTTMRYCLTSVRMTVIKKAKNNECWWGCGEKGMLLPCWWACKLLLSLWKTVWRFLPKLRIELPYDPTILILDIYPKNTKTLIQKEKS